MDCLYWKKHNTCSLACRSFCTTCPETRLTPEEKAVLWVVAVAMTIGIIIM